MPFDSTVQQVYTSQPLCISEVLPKVLNQLGPKHIVLIYTLTTYVQVSIFKHGLFKNTVTIFGTLISLIVMLLIVYAPFLQPIFGTAQLSGIGWVPQLGFAVGVFVYNEMSKRNVRRDPDGWWARHMQW